MTGMENVPSKHGVYFLELSLENVRCFGEKVTIDLRDPQDKSKPARWTVLVGENGVGKTTVLRSLVSVGPEAKVHDGGGVDAFQYSINDHLWLPRRNQNPYEFGCIISLFEHGFDSGCSDSQKFRLSFPEASEQIIWLENPPKFRNASFAILAYGASRQMSRQSIEEDPLKNASLSLFKDNAELTNASELYHQSYITSQKEGNNLLHETIEQIILNVLPDVTGIRTTKVGTLTWRAEVETPYGWVWIHDLSLGYKTMVAWIVDFASKLFLLYPNSSNPLAEPAVCLVDEIDLHMHPTWQRKIMGFLTEKFPNTQFIVTAHSPLMVQAAAEANIVLLKREGDHVVVDNDPIVVKNWSVDQILASVFGVSSRTETTEKNMARRRALIAQGLRTAAEEQELQNLEKELAGYSYLESPEEMEAASLMREFAAIVRERKKDAAQ